MAFEPAQILAVATYRHHYHSPTHYSGGGGPMPWMWILVLSAVVVGVIIWSARRQRND